MLLFRSMLRLNLLHSFTRSHTLSTFYEMLQSRPEKRRMMPVLTLLRFMNWYKVDLELVVFLKSHVLPSYSYFPSEIPVAQTHRPSPHRHFLLKLMICSLLMIGSGPKQGSLGCFLRAEQTPGRGFCHWSWREFQFLEQCVLARTLEQARDMKEGLICRAVTVTC